MRRQSPQTQLEWVDPETLGWEDLPAGVRERVGAQLAALLRRAAARAATAQEPPDDE